MKVITADQGLASFRKIFKEMQEHKQKVVFWQVLHGHRTVCETVLISSMVDAQLLSFLPPDQDFILSHPIFFYVEDQQLIFKAQVESQGAKTITVNYPAEIRLLDQDDEAPKFLDYKVKTFMSARINGGTEKINDFVKVKSMKERTSRDQDFLNQEFDHVTLDEEDKIYADKRESPRVRPKADKLVKIVKKGESRVQLMKLFDLSRGGMGFITFNPDQFPKASEVFVVGFDAFELDDPLVGTVMSHRPVDGTNIEFKIGIKFNDGQE